MLNNKRKKIFLFLLFVFFFSSFMLFSFLNKKIENTEYKLDLNFKNNGNIFISTKLPISDKLGKSINEIDDMKSYIEFSINNSYDKRLNYDLYLISKRVDKPLNDSYVKFYLTNDKNIPCNGFEKNIIPSYADLKFLDDSSGKLLYTGFIDSNTTDNYILRVWISDTYPFGNDLKYFESSINIVVR